MGRRRPENSGRKGLRENHSSHKNTASPGGPGDTASTIHMTNRELVFVKFISSLLQLTCCIFKEVCLCPNAG